MQSEEIFSFIKNKLLKQHLIETLDLSIELWAMADHYSLRMQSAFYKVIIIYLASILEACVHYCILELGYEHYQGDWIYKEMKILYDLDDHRSTQLVAGKRVRKQIGLKRCIDFSVLNRFSYHSVKLYDARLYEEVEKVRKLRNMIHLMSISEIDRIYGKTEVNQVAEITTKIIDIIAKKLK